MHWLHILRPVAYNTFRGEEGHENFTTLNQDGRSLRCNDVRGYRIVESYQLAIQDFPDTMENLSMGAVSSIKDTRRRNIAMVYVDIHATNILTRQAFQGSALMRVFSLSLGNGIQSAVKAIPQGWIGTLHSHRWASWGCFGIAGKLGGYNVGYNSTCS
jgi:hypothetical protein